MPEWSAPARYSESDALERFIDNIWIDENGCWRWMAGHTDDGYGRFSLRGKWMGAHRAAWILFRYEIPPTLHVLHRCDVRDCARPVDLFLGTNADNVADKITKGRIGRVAKLNEQAVLVIRARHRQGVSQTRLAREFGVTVGAISKVVHRKTWDHVA